VAKKSDRYAAGKNETQEIHSKYKKFTLNTRNSLEVQEIHLQYKKFTFEVQEIHSKCKKFILNTRNSLEIQNFLQRRRDVVAKGARHLCV